MPVYLLTFDVYRSWSPGNPRGYVRHGEARIRNCDPRVAADYEARARQQPVRFDHAQQVWLLAVAQEACQLGDYRLHAIAATVTHVYLLISWRLHTGWKTVGDQLKRVLGYRLSKQAGSTGQRWFSRGYSRKQVRDRSHLARLLQCYLPGHRRQHGCVWCETQA